MPEEPEFLTPEILSTVAALAEEADPDEVCGVIHRSGKVRRAANVQDALHAVDPQRYARTARTAFTMSDGDLLHLYQSLDGDDPVVVVFHSHPGGVGAYFSAEDSRRSLFDGTPVYDVDHLVISVSTDGHVDVARLYRWERARGFFEVDAYVFERSAP